MLRRAVSPIAVVLAAGAVLAACGDDGGGDGEGRGRLGRATVKDVPLEGTQWVLDQEATALETVARNVTVTARFADGTLSGNAGCNSYTTSYSASGSRLTVSEAIATTRMACPPPASNVEAAYLELLPSARSYAIAGRVLTLATTTRGVSIVYRAVSGTEAVAGKWEAINYFRPGAVVSVLAGTRITAEFADGRVAGDAGCNTYTAPVAVDGSSIRIGPIASTLRACADPAVDQQERDYLAALELARSWRLDRGNLTLLRDDGGIAVTFARA